MTTRRIRINCRAASTSCSADLPSPSSMTRRSNADPDFKAKAAARMKALHADPDFKAKAAARMKALHADPDFKAKTAARMKALNADRKNKLPPLSKEQRKIYTKLRARLGRDAALQEALR